LAGKTPHFRGSGRRNRESAGVAKKGKWLRHKGFDGEFVPAAVAPTELIPAKSLAQSIRGASEWGVSPCSERRYGRLAYGRIGRNGRFGEVISRCFVRSCSIDPQVSPIS